MHGIAKAQYPEEEENLWNGPPAHLRQAERLREEPVFRSAGGTGRKMR